MEQQHIMVWGIIVKDPAKNREAVNGVLDQFREQLTLQGHTIPRRKRKRPGPDLYRNRHATLQYSGNTGRFKRIDP